MEANKSILEVIKTYYSLFGVRGVLYAAKSRMVNNPQTFTVQTPNIAAPIYLRACTSDISAYAEVIAGLEYEFELAVKPRVIIDAGANIGLTSIYYANLYPGARIFSIEPETSNYELLVKNAAPYANIIPIRAALWKEVTEVCLFDSGLGNWAFQTLKDPAPGTGSGCVPGITIDKIIEEHKIGHVDILKIDIEGSEREVFENASGWIDKVGVIAIELHEWFSKGSSEPFFNATKDFECEYRRGETVFRYRKSFARGYGQ